MNITNRNQKLVTAALLWMTAAGSAACSSESNSPIQDTETSREALMNRAYIVSRDQDALTVIDLAKLEIIGIVQTGTVTAHMAELNKDFTKIYVSSTDTNETVVIDAKTLGVTSRIPVAKEPAHLTLSRDGRFIAAGNEGGGAVSFIDTVADKEAHRVNGLHFPKFIRFSEDGRYAYTANGDAHHITKIDMTTFGIVEEIALEGFPVPTKTTTEEGGFADVQIDHNGILWAAHGETGRILFYDTRSETKLGEAKMGARPWVVYAEHPFGALIPRHYVPFHEDETVGVLDKQSRALLGTVAADRESFGVNYSPLVPNFAFVMNREHEDVSVVDTDSQQLVTRIAVGGNTETAATTPDGKYIVATVGTANRVVVIDATELTIVKTFDNLPEYPWSVTIPMGQNYCH